MKAAIEHLQSQLDDSKKRIAMLEHGPSVLSAELSAYFERTMNDGSPPFKALVQKYEPDVGPTTSEAPLSPVISPSVSVSVQEISPVQDFTFNTPEITSADFRNGGENSFVLLTTDADSDLRQLKT